MNNILMLFSAMMDYFCNQNIIPINSSIFNLKYY